MKTHKSYSGLKLAGIILFIAAAVFTTVNFKQVSTFTQTKFNQYFTYSVCDKPIAYKIGSVDPQFGISNNQFLTDTKDAISIWDKVEDKKLFIYNPQDPRALTINLVFDKRTALNNQINDLAGQVKQKDQSLQSRIDAYELQEAAFRKKLADFKARVDVSNEQIAYWNQRGGAPADQYQKLNQQQNDLKNEQASLKAEADSLNQTAQQLNLSTQNYNADVDKLNSTINTFDQAIALKPEEGLYDSENNTIKIYFDINHEELIHTLAHEMGHALGIEHNQNKQSIMYPYATQSVAVSKEDISALQAICDQRLLNLPFSDQYRSFLNNLLKNIFT